VSSVRGKRPLAPPLTSGISSVIASIAVAQTRRRTLVLLEAVVVVGIGKVLGGVRDLGFTLGGFMGRVLCWGVNR
jgi:hypothetical protein